MDQLDIDFFVVSQPTVFLILYLCYHSIIPLSIFYCIILYFSEHYGRASWAGPPKSP